MNIKAFIFDWDGVFNNGQKNANSSSNFNETDSMGTNLLRYSYFLTNGVLPITAVISGEKNEAAFYFCERECFKFSFFKISKFPFPDLSIIRFKEALSILINLIR